MSRHSEAHVFEQVGMHMGWHGGFIQYAAPRHVAGINRLCLRQARVTNRGMQAVGTNQQVTLLHRSV